jgi:UDP-glucuronate decarboxylase
MLNSKKVLITGAAGFLGSHLCEFYLERGFGVVGIDNFYTGTEKNVSFLKAKYPRFEFYQMAVQELNQPATSLESLTDLGDLWCIFHMACPASPYHYQKDMLYTLETCYLGTKAVFELALKRKARVLIASTSEVYGNPLVHPQTESYLGNVNCYGIRSCYDEGKRVAETLGFIFEEQFGLDLRIARIFNTYGPRMNPNDGRVVTNLITHALEGKSLPVYGDGSQTRSFCYVSDQVEGLSLLMESELKGPTNVGTDYEFTILELALLVRSLINPGLKLEFFPMPKDDPLQRRADYSRMYDSLGWSPRVSLEEGLKNYIRWARE